MNTSKVLRIVASTLRNHLTHNEEPSNDLIKIVTDAIIDAELAEEKKRFEYKQERKLRELRDAVINGIEPAWSETIQESVLNGRSHWPNSLPTD